jgi:hypothetical protein
MIRVAALTSGRNVPSSRFRVRQFLPALRAEGIDVREFVSPITKYASASIRPLAWALTGTKLALRLPSVTASRRFDLVWLERELVPGRTTLERFTGRPRLFDVDDALWLGGQPGFSEEIARRCDGVVAGNEFLAAHYRGAGARAWVVPTSVDTDAWVPRATRSESREWTIGWSGSRSTLPELEALEGPLRDLFAEIPDLRLRFETLPARRWQFEAWTADRELSLMQRMDVGLMPLADSEWARGKCGLKMLLYMAVGIPVVASPVGVAAEILAMSEIGLAATSREDWSVALRRLATDRGAAARMGATGRQVVERAFAVKVNAGRLAAIFREVAGA